MSQRQSEVCVAPQINNHEVNKAANICYLINPTINDLPELEKNF